MDYPKYVIFDFDKTIATLVVDWTKWHLGAGAIFQKYDPNFRQHLEGKKIYHLQNEMFAKFGPKLKKDIDEFTKKFEAEEVRRVDPIIETVNLTKYLYLNGSKLYIWSSNDYDLVAKNLKELNILNKFEFLITRDKVDFLKPNTSGFDKYLVTVDGNLKNFLMVGDSDSDREAAKNSGINYLDVLEI